MASKTRRAARPPASIHRYSPRTRLLAGILAVVMLGGVVTVGIASLADRGGSGGGNEAVVPNPCPALDKSDGPKTLFTARPVYCLVSGVAYTAVFDTSEGEIRFTLDRARMPETTNNFVALARYGYYDNTLLFRIDPSIGIIQGGSPTTNDWSDPGPGYTIPDEGGAFHRLANEGVSGPFSYESGQLVMARKPGELNSSGAQGSYLLFGATDNAGQSVLDAMMDLYVVDPESPYGGGPSHEIVVHSVTIVEG